MQKTRECSLILVDDIEANNEYIPYDPVSMKLLGTDLVFLLGQNQLNIIHKKLNNIENSDHVYKAVRIDDNDQLF